MSVGVALAMSCKTTASWASLTPVMPNALSSAVVRAGVDAPVSASVMTLLTIPAKVAKSPGVSTSAAVFKSITLLSRPTSSGVSMLVAPKSWNWACVRLALLLSLPSAASSRALTASATACSSLVLSLLPVTTGAR